ncbi:MAG: serine hydrolase domain-containing protein [Acidobacteriota bacterium]
MTRRRLALRTAIALLVALSAGLTLSAQTPPVLKYGPASSVGMDQAVLDQAVDLFRQAVARDEIRGAVLMVARRGTIVMHEALGWRHVAYRLPMEKDTLFRMASNTKPLVASAVLLLEQDGKLSVSDRAGAHVSSLDNYRWREVTIAHLLSHSSGLRIGPIFLPFDEAKDTSAPPTLQHAVAKFGPLGPEFAPGTTYSYNNAGYNTLGAIIERASGMPLEDFLRTRIYQLLGMTDTLNHEDASKLARMATVYSGRKGDDGIVAWTQRFTPGDAPDFPVIRASGGMISTALDYGKFLQMYLNGGEYGGTRILTASSIAKATTSHIDAGKDGGYGFGWMISRDGVYAHSGSDGTYAWVDPKRDLFGLVFTQSPGGTNPRAKFKEVVTGAVRN